MRFVALLSLFWATPGQRLQLGDTTLIGKHFQSSNVDFFGGIPYAEPPVGDLRLSRPRPKHSLSPLRSFDARSYGLPCLQPVSHTPFTSLRMPTRPSIQIGICQRIALSSTYSDLRAST